MSVLSGDHKVDMAFLCKWLQQCTINIWGTPWNRVWVLVNTLKHGTIVNIAWVSFVGWHEVARVLQSPCWWTASFSWDYCDFHPCWSIAHSTGNIVVMNSFEWSCSWLILNYSAPTQCCDVALQVGMQGSLDHWACRGSWHLLQCGSTSFLQPFLHTPAQFQWHLGSCFFPTSYRPPLHFLHQEDLLLLALPSVLEAHKDQADRLVHPFHPSLAAPQCRGGSLYWYHSL